MNITQVLLDIQANEEHVRVPAQQQLEKLEQSNLGQYLQLLTQEFADESKPQNSRQQAGIAIKNAFSGTRDEKKKKQLEDRWFALPEQGRNQIKALLLRILSSPTKIVRSTAAYAVSKLAGIEIPRKVWSDFVKTLVSNIMKPNAPNPQQAAAVRSASFEILGYLCEDIPESLGDHSNEILTAISSGMRKEESEDIRLVATVALANALNFVEENFKRENERNLIMQMIFSSATAPEEKIRVAAFQALVAIASLYYPELKGGNIIENIYKLTGASIQNHLANKESEDVAFLAVEFWSTIADIEIALIRNAAEADEGEEVQPNLKFCSKAITGLVPLLLQALTRQSEDFDDDTRNISKDAATCLDVLARAVGDEILPLTMPFIKTNASNNNWRLKDAALVTFGYILDGPSHKTMAENAKAALPLIVNSCKDQNMTIRDSAAWTLGRICSHTPDAIDANSLNIVMQTILGGLKDKPKIASSYTWAIHNLAEAVEADDENRSSPLSPHFQSLCAGLLQCADRPDSNEANLLPTCFDALQVLIIKSASDVQPILTSLLPNLMNRLSSSIEKNANILQQASAAAQSPSGIPQNLADAVEKIIGQQTALCTCIDSIIPKLTKATIEQQAGNIMHLVLRVLQQKQASGMEESLLIISSVAGHLKNNFNQYMVGFRPFILQALQNHQAYKSCQIAVGVVGDLARHMEGAFQPHAHDFMRALLFLLSDQHVARSIKPHAVSAVADIAMAVGNYFENYLPFVLKIFVGASKFNKEQVGDEDLEYLNELRYCLLEGFTAVVQCLSADSNDNRVGKILEVMNNSLEPIAAFFDLIWAENIILSEEVLKYSCGLIGDLISNFGKFQHVAHSLARPSVKELIKMGLKADDEITKENASFAAEELQRLGK